MKKENVLICCLVIVSIILSTISCILNIKTQNKMDETERKVDNLIEEFKPEEEGWQIDDYDYLSDEDYVYSETYDTNE